MENKIYKHGKKIYQGARWTFRRRTDFPAYSIFFKFIISINFKFEF